MNDAQKIGASVATLLAACALAAPVVSRNEGNVPRPYFDPVNVLTVCSGHTGKDIIRDKTYTSEECANILASDLVKHAADIGPCVPANLPVKTYAAFISFTFNIGSQKFCSSTLSRKAREGDLTGACNELPRWVTAQTPQGRKTLPGLVRRREEEKALCLEGVADLRPRQGIPS